MKEWTLKSLCTWATEEIMGMSKSQCREFSINLLRDYILCHIQTCLFDNPLCLIKIVLIYLCLILK
jgi:hypothetical protein